MPEGFLPPLILELKAKAGEVLTEMKGVSKEADEMAAKTGGSSSKVSSSLSKLSGMGKAALIGLGSAAVAVGVESIHMAEAMQSSDAKIAGSAQISVGAATKIGDAFLHTAGDSTFSGKQMADAFGPVAGVVQKLAGHTLTAADSMKVMSAATDLAEASGQPLDQTTAALTSTMLAFGIGVSGASDASNVLFNTSRLTGVGITTLSATMTKMHARLGVVAPDLATVGGLMNDLASHGVTGSRGVMVAQTALQTLLGGSKKTGAEMQALGLNVYNASGKFVGMGSLLNQVTPKLAGMSDKQRMAAETALFGATSAQAMNSTILAGAGVFDKATKAVQSHDAVQKAAEASSNSLHGQVEKLKSGFDDIVTLLGEKLIPIISKTITWFTKHKTAVMVLAGVIAGVLTVAIGTYVGKMAWGAAETVGKLAMMVAGWLGLGPAIEATAAESEVAGATMDAAFGPVGLAIAGVVVAATLLATHWKQVWHDVKAWFSDAVTFVKRYSLIFAGALTIMLGPIGLVLGAVLLLATHWQQVWGAMKTALAAVESAWDATWKAVKSVYDATIAPVFNFIKAHWGILFAVVTGGLSLLIQHWRSVWGAVKSVYSGVIEPVFHAIESVFDSLSGAVSRSLGFVETVFSRTFGFIGQIVQRIESVIQDMQSIWDGVWDDVGGAVEAAWQFIQPIIDTIKQAVNDTVGAVGKVTGAISHGVGGVGHAIASIFGDGGWTPGGTGQASHAIVHGGEYVLSNAMLTGSAPIDPNAAAAVMSNLGKNVMTGGVSSFSGATGSIMQKPAAPTVAASQHAVQGGGVTVIVQGSVVDTAGLFKAVQKAALQHGVKNSQTWAPYKRK